MAVSSLLGAGVAWGVMRSEVRSLRKDLTAESKAREEERKELDAERATDRRAIGEQIAAIYTEIHEDRRINRESGIRLDAWKDLQTAAVARLETHVTNVARQLERIDDKLAAK